MKVKIYISLFFLVVSQLLIAQAEKYSYNICTWKNDKDGAISISFDDASYVQYKYAYPVLERFGIKASFSLVGEWTKDDPSDSSEPGIFDIKKMGWKNIIDLYQSGHEICAHGFKHVRYNRDASLDTLVNQMKKIKELIEAKVGNKCTTLHYPYSQTSESITLAANKAGFLFGRTGEEKINPASPQNMYLLGTKAIWSEANPTIDDLTSYIKEANGKWLIFMYHHLFEDDSKAMEVLRYHKIKNTYSLLPKSFENQMQIVFNSDYWVAPISTIGKYIEERNHTQIEMYKCFNRLEIKSNSDLDKSIYNEKITLKVELPWKKVKVYVGDKVLIYNVSSNYILIDFVPGQEITIKKLR